MSDPGFGVYVHWPYCLAKCPYCDFNSHVARGPIDQERFVAALTTEMRTLGTRTTGREVASVFFGGGTPSLMDAATVAAVLDAVASVWTVARDAEITLEANPTSVEAERFAGYRAAGVNRVSVGIQALNDAHLKALGRLHSVEEALAALETAQRHFDRVSFDLIYARPRQSLREWRSELKCALALGSEHLSLYQLTMEPGTPFADLHARGRLSIPDESLAADFYELTQELCTAAGFAAYEVSNHARSGAESRHNMIYWRYGEYVGLGPGAHGRIQEQGTRHALSAFRDPKVWLEAVEARGHGLEEDMVLSPEEQFDELLVMGLRLADGIKTARLNALGLPLPDPSKVAELCELGLLCADRAPDCLAPTAAGRLLTNRLAAELASRA